MLVMLISTAVWGWGTYTALPYVFAGRYGPWQTSTQPWYFTTLAVMLISTLAALFAVNRGLIVLRQSQPFKLNK